MCISTHSLHSFLTLALDGGEWSISGPGHITPMGRKGFYIHQMRGWVGRELV